MLPDFRIHFRSLLLAGISIALAMGAAPRLLPAQDEAAQQREQIGNALGKPVYRDQIRTNDGASLASELHRLFTSAAIQEYREQHKDEITPTATEIAKATKLFDQQHRDRMREQEPDLERQLKAIDEKLAVVGLEKAEQEKLSIRKQTIQQMMTPPGEFFATFVVKNLKFQRHLYLKFGGGRILFQQFGLEAFDASRKWLESLEAAGKFTITDAELRSVLYHYYTDQEHGSFLSRDEESIREITEPKWLEQPKPEK